MLHLSRNGVVLALSLACVAAPAFGQFEGTEQRANAAYLDISIEAATHLRTAASYVGDENWPEALDLFQKLIENFGNKVVRVGQTPVYVSVRDYCHMQIAALPAEARELYRSRLDAQAEAWYRAGVAKRDVELLTRVVDNAFCSSSGDDALGALAELAFEAGRFEEARSLWRQIGTGADAPGTAEKNDDQAPRARLIYPDTNLDAALVEAKKILCHVFLGERELVAREIADFGLHHPEATGTLGATDGLLADRLAAIAREHVRPDSPEDGSWSTFAGNARRSKVVPRPVDIGSVQWSAPLPQISVQRPARPRSIPTINADDLLSYHPLVLRDWVIVAGGEEVWAYDLHDSSKEARPAWVYRLRDGDGEAPPVAVRPVEGTQHYTLTEDGGRLYVRLGAPQTAVPRRAIQPDSYLVCLELATQGKELWRVKPDEPDLAFEGSPVVADGSVYVAVTRGGAMSHAFVACYDAATGALKWRRLVCETSSATMFYPSTVNHNLLTLGAGMVFYNTNLGAIAALDQRSGRVHWITTYPRAEAFPPANKAFGSRQLGPCLYHEGLVIALPSDGEGIFALDALTGELRWRTIEPPNIGHLLGVAHGNLICSGSQVIAIELASGRRVWQWPEGPGPQAHGRGILAGDLVYFPTKTQIHILDQRTGGVAKPPLALVEAYNQQPGNMVIGDGHMVIAQAKTLTVFCEYDLLIDRYRDLIARNPTSADPHFRLARAAQAVGSFDLAVEHYRHAVNLSHPGEQMDGRDIRQFAQTQLYALLATLGHKAAKDGQPITADGHYRDAVDVAPSPQAKLEALLFVAELWESANDAAKSLAAYQDVLADDALCGLGIKVGGDRFVRADVEIANRVQALIDRFGRGVYASYDTEAAAAFRQAQRDESLPAVERVLGQYPNSDVFPRALLYLANQYVAQAQWQSASAAFKRLLARSANPPDVQLAAWHGLAQVQESQQFWQAARLSWQRLAQDFPDVPLPSRPEQSVASFVAEHLSGPPFSEAVEPERARVALPLDRRWTRSWENGSRVLVPEGKLAPDQEPALLVSRGPSVACVAIASGQSLWSHELDAPLRWATFHGESMILGTDSQLVRLRAATGELEWRQHMTASDETAPAPPAAQPENSVTRPAAAAAASAKSKAAEFAIQDDRLFVNEGGQRLVCRSAETGELHWRYTPTDGTILPQTLLSGPHVVLRTRLPGKLVVLDSDGKSRFELAPPGVSWVNVPVALDASRVCVPTDPRTVQLLDLTDGKAAWEFKSPRSDRVVQPIASAGMVFVLIGGNELVRLEASSGRHVWARQISDDPLPETPHAWAVDDRAFYCVTRELNLRAFRLADGELEWQQALVGPGEQWRIALSADYVVALPWQPHATEGLPVAFLGARDGRLVQRLVLRPRGKESVLGLAAPHVLVGSEREVWSLGAEKMVARSQ